MNDPSYATFKAQDTRFDGCFGTGRTTTDLCCHPVYRMRPCGATTVVVYMGPRVLGAAMTGVCGSM